jgi:hypothetical protein
MTSTTSNTQPATETLIPEQLVTLAAFSSFAAAVYLLTTVLPFMH